MAGPLKGYLWPTERSYGYIIGNQETKHVINTFCSWLTPYSVFYDLGSNIGYFSFIANIYITKGKIYAFEPTGFNIDLFKHLQLLNKKLLIHNSIKLLEFAISDSEKEVEFSYNKILAESNTYVESTVIYTGERIKVKCYSIDGLVEMGYPAPNVIKIDIEGAEYDALIGATNTLIKYKPNLLLATHNCKVPGVKEKCLAYLKELGYTLEHTGYQNRAIAGLDDYIAIHRDNLKNI